MSYYFKIAIVVFLIAIVIALAKACYNLVSRKGSSSNLFKALSWRIGLSILLFAFLFFGEKMGWIKPSNPFQVVDPAQHLSKQKPK